MIDKIIKYVQERIPVTVTSSSTTCSKYLHYANSSKSVRISDHFGSVKDNVDLSVIIPESPDNFILSVGFKTFVYTSFQKTAEFIISYMIIENSVLNRENTKIVNQSKAINDLQNQVNKLAIENDKLHKLNDQLQNLNKNLASNGKESELKKKVERQAAEIQVLNEKQTESKAMIKQKNEAIQEAVELIEQLTINPKLRDMVSHEGKKYYLDHFDPSVRDIVEDLIKNYYK